MNLQESVERWVNIVDPYAPRRTRALRFLEEAIELAQSAGLSMDDIESMMVSVYVKEPGYLPQEIGGCCTALMAFSSCEQSDLFTLAQMELERMWRDIDKIKERNKRKVR